MGGTREEEKAGQTTIVSLLGLNHLFYTCFSLGRVSTSEEGTEFCLVWEA